MAEFVICLPVLTLILISIIEFGELRIKQLILSMAAYEAAHASLQGLDGKAAAETFLKNYKITNAEIAVAKHYSIVNYFESSITYDIGPNKFLQQFLPEPMTITKKARAYCEKHFVITGDAAYEDGQIFQTIP